MSDYYDDSFDSESGSENGAGEREEGEDEVQSSGAAMAAATREIQVTPNLLASPRLSAALRGSGSASDLEEQETSSRPRSDLLDLSLSSLSQYSVF